MKLNSLWFLVFSLLVFFGGIASSDVIFNENFSGSHPGAWSIGHDGGVGNYSWAWPNGYAHAYSNPNGGQYYYPDNLHVYMERRSVDLSGYTSATLSFSYIVDTEAVYDYFTVNVRDQSGNWHELYKKSGETDPLVWQTKQIDLSQFAGQNSLYIQFRFDSDGSVSGNPRDGVYIDNVSLEAEIQTNPPVVSRLSPSNSNISISIGANQIFTVAAYDPDGDLANVEWFLGNTSNAWHTINGTNDTDSWSHTFNNIGTYNVYAYVYDSQNQQSMIWWTINVTNSTPSSPTFNTTPPGAVYPTKTYDITVNYTDPDGASDIKNCYLRLAQNDNTETNRQTLMWWPNETYAQWNDETHHMTILDVNKMTIPNGYRLTWTIKFNWGWQENSNIDYYAWTQDNNNLQSSFAKNNRNAKYESDLCISGSNIDDSVLNPGETCTITGAVTFEGTSVKPNDWNGISVKLHKNSTSGTILDTDTSVSNSYFVSWTPTENDAGDHTLYVVVHNTNHEPPGGSTWYDSESAKVLSKSGTILSTIANGGNTFQTGQSKTVTVKVKNTGRDDANLIIECASLPSGWSVSQTSQQTQIYYGTEHNFQFTVTAPNNASNGDLVWKLYWDDTFPSPNTLLDTKNQPVSVEIPIQAEFFDDFIYTNSTDSNYINFARWRIIDGVSGPPEGGIYDEQNISFETDPNNSSNKLLRLDVKTRNTFSSMRLARIETKSQKFLEGTYAARVNFADSPNSWNDGTIQAFYSINTEKGTDYSECDFEYLAYNWFDGPNVDLGVKKLWNVTWDYKDPLAACDENRKCDSLKSSFANWRIIIFVVKDGKVSYFNNANLLYEHSGFVYPEKPMMISLCHWLSGNDEYRGDSPDERIHKMYVDWVYFAEDIHLSYEQVISQVTKHRNKGTERLDTVSSSSTVNKDFDGNGKTDILWRNISNGFNYIWSMDGSTLVSSKGIPTVADLDLKVAGTSDFDGNGKSDILWRNISTGSNYIWLMDGATLISSNAIPTVTDLNLKIIGTGDFDGNGQADILWRNISTGFNYIWLMDGATLVSSNAIPTVVDLNLKIVGTGDFNGDGKSDILWRNISTGFNYIWLMDGATIISSNAIPTAADLNLKIVGTGDFNGDGKSDILWRNISTGFNYIWLMDGATLVSSNAIPTVVDLNLKIVGTGDFNGDGKSDILWRNISTGFNYIWLMDGATLVSSNAIPTVADLNLNVVGYNSESTEIVNSKSSISDMKIQKTNIPMDIQQAGEPMILEKTNIPMEMEKSKGKMLYTEPAFYDRMIIDNPGKVIFKNE